MTITLIGHTIAWCCIILAVRQPQISAWSLLLAIIYPVSETMITVLRRLKARKNVFLPDQLHIHHLLWKKLSSRSFSHRLSNSIASAIILSGAFATTLFAGFYQSTAHCFSLAACLSFSRLPVQATDGPTLDGPEVTPNENSFTEGATKTDVAIQHSQLAKANMSLAFSAFMTANRSSSASRGRDCRQK